MPSRTLKSTNKLFALAALCLGSSAAFCQLNSNTPTVVLNATLGETLTVAATPGTVNFTLVPGGVAAGSAPVVVTTTWVLASGRANVVLDAYFGSPASALASTTGTPVANIPTSSVLGEVTSGTPTVFTPFTQTGVVGTAGAGLTLFTQALTASNRASNRTDNLLLEIDLTALPQLPAAAYTGTLTLQAQAL